VNIKDENKALLFLRLIPRSFEHVKNTILYENEDTNTLEEFQVALRIKRSTKSRDMKVDDNG